MSDQSTKTVLVTGTSSGIGAACAEALSAEGWRVYAGVRTAAEVKASKSTGSSSVMKIALDVTKARSIAAAAKRVREETGSGLHGLVNNAGIPGAGPVETVPLDVFRSVIETNLIGQFAVTQAFLPQIRQAKGRIVFISSLGGRVAFPYASPYHASKFGLEGLAESLRAEMAPFEVAVSLVEPGSMATDIWAKGRSSLTESRERMTDEQRSAYGKALAGFDQQLSAQEESEDPSEVAAKVVSALTDGSPSLRYLVGRGAGTLTKMKGLLPGPVFDRITQQLASRGN